MTVENYLFFDSASTTKCCDQAVEVMRYFSDLEYGNPSSSHVMGQKSARAIREARLFFANFFKTAPDQVIFTGSGTEANNLAVYGTCLSLLAKSCCKGALLGQCGQAPRVIVSAIEHPAVLKTAASLADFGFDIQFAPVNAQGKIIKGALLDLVTPQTVLVSIMCVNNIVGSIQPIEELASAVKTKVPQVIFHSDCVQTFGKTEVPQWPSPVDLISLSGHKVEGPKGVGALIILNPELLKTQALRPLIWGGSQEGGFRSGTQNAGLISAFHISAQKALENKTQYTLHAKELRTEFKKCLEEKKLLDTLIHWNSPEDAIPQINSISAPGFPPGPLTKFLEERGCLISTGSACSSKKAEPEKVLMAMGLPTNFQNSALRVSFSAHNKKEEVQKLTTALDESIRQIQKLLG